MLRVLLYHLLCYGPRKSCPNYSGSTDSICCIEYECTLADWEVVSFVFWFLFPSRPFIQLRFGRLLFQFSLTVFLVFLVDQSDISSNFYMCQGIPKSLGNAVTQESWRTSQTWICCFVRQIFDLFVTTSPLTVLRWLLVITVTMWLSSFIKNHWVQLYVLFRYCMSSRSCSVPW